MTTRDPRTGRYVRTANTPESSEGEFETYTDLPVVIQGDDPGQLAYDAVPRRGPTADTLAGPAYPSRLRPRDAVLYGGDDGGHAQGAVLRAAGRLHGVGGMIGAVLGIDDTPRPPRTVQNAGQVFVHYDHNPLSPGAALLRQHPGRTPGRMNTASDDPADNAEEIERRVDEGLFGYTPGVHQEYVRDFLRPANRGLGRGRDRS
jgi:hypothetical protein